MGIDPIEINKDVWFYPVGKTLEFTVYVDGKPKLFNVKLRTILKAFNVKVTNKED